MWQFNNLERKNLKNSFAWEQNKKQSVKLWSTQHLLEVLGLYALRYYVVHVWHNMMHLWLCDAVLCLYIAALTNLISKVVL